MCSGGDGLLPGLMAHGCPGWVWPVQLPMGQGAGGPADSYCPPGTFRGSRKAVASTLVGILRGHRGGSARLRVWAPAGHGCPHLTPGLVDLPLEGASEPRGVLPLASRSSWGAPCRGKGRPMPWAHGCPLGQMPSAWAPPPQAPGADGRSVRSLPAAGAPAARAIWDSVTLAHVAVGAAAHLCAHVWTWGRLRRGRAHGPSPVPSLSLGILRFLSPGHGRPSSSGNSRTQVSPPPQSAVPSPTLGNQRLSQRFGKNLPPVCPACMCSSWKP